MWSPCTKYITLDRHTETKYQNRQHKRLNLFFFQVKYNISLIDQRWKVGNILKYVPELLKLGK